MQENDLKLVLQKLGVKVTGRNEQRHRKRVWLNFHCPLAPYSAGHRFKADRSPSAGAVADTLGKISVWQCKGCKATGPIEALARALQKAENKPTIPYEMICEEIATIETTGLGSVQFGQDLEINELGPPLDPDVYDGLYPAAWDVPAARAYLQGRNISQATAEKLELCYNPERHRVMFPVRHQDGGLYGYSQRAIGDAKPKILDEDLPKWHLILGSHLWRPGLPLFVVEGLFAYARQFENGVDEIVNVGALLGSEMTDGKAELIMLQDGPVYLLPDGDPAGDACLFGKVKMQDGVEVFDPQTGELERTPETGAVHKLYGQVPLYLPVFPDGKDDPDQLTREDVETMLAETRPFGAQEVTFGAFSR